MAVRWCLTSTLLIAFGHQVTCFNLRHPSKKTVCVSLAAYEQPAYVEALVENFLHFSEPTTKLALHLHRSSEYNGTEQNWVSDRVAVTSERIDVAAFRGSIIYAHMLNVETMAKTWPETCEYWVLQASNMMWVRSGMEDYVRQNEYSPIREKTQQLASSVWSGVWAGQCQEAQDIEKSKTYVDFSEKLSSKKQVFGKGQPDGSFFPFSAVQRFKAMMDKHLRQEHGDASGIIDARCYFENVWLQTYSLNYENYPGGKEDKARRKAITPLCRSELSYDNKDDDSIPMSELRKVMKGKPQEYEGYFAVKRVNRNINHPTTRFIMNLAK